MLRPPEDPTQVGWWTGGAFDVLDAVTVGDTVGVRGASGRHRYRVTSVRYLDRDRLARAAGRLFAATGPPRLVLVTCEEWNGRTYEGNTVVVAEPAPRPGATDQ